MVVIIAGLSAILLILLTLIGVSFLISSIWEKEPRATVWAGIQLVPLILLSLYFIYLWHSGTLNTPNGLFWLSAILVFGLLGIWLCARKTASNTDALSGTSGLIKGTVERFDERDQVFARNRSLRPGSEQYARYYETHPDTEAIDTLRRKRGGVNGQPGFIDRPHERPNLAASAAWGTMAMRLSAPEMLRPQPLAPFRNKPVPMNPDEATTRIKGHTLNLGADLVGIAELNPLWVYARRGEIFHDNWEQWGQPINTDHRYAVVFATEMSLDVISSSPHTTSSIESQNQYAKGAYIATLVAQFIANLGYNATVNHVRHYETLMVPLAVDAGLGEISRMGYLINKELGPRLRLGVVTTDMPLMADKPVDIGVADFCEVCKKCAVCCPSDSIPADEPRIVNGTLRWKLNAESCFDYWGKIGTGCNICMRVCPWSHARTLPHRLIVEMVSRNALSRRLFTVMDDLFYGRKPKPKTPPPWASFSSVQSAPLLK